MADLLPIKDVAGLSKPITKLIETIGSAIGTLYDPTRIRKEAEAEADAAIIRAKAQSEVEIIEYFASERIKYLELRRQRNIQKITEFAQEQLPENVSDEKVDEDWTVQFFNIAQDVGNEDMQMIWAKLLAGEIVQPGSFSLQTLQVMKMLSRKDAVIFKNLCDYVWGTKFIINYHAMHDFFDAKGFSWPSLLNLETLGLIQFHVGWNIQPNETRNLSYFGELYSFRNQTKYSTRFEGLGLSIAGIEVFSICERKPDFDYISALTEYFSKGDASFIMAKA